MTRRRPTGPSPSTRAWLSALAAVSSLALLASCYSEEPLPGSTADAGSSGSAGTSTQGTGTPGDGSPTAGTDGGTSGSSTASESTEPADGEDSGNDIPPAVEGPVEITIAAIGDILAHSRLNIVANINAGGAPGEYDYSPMLADVAPLISSADLALCHLETPLSADNTNLSVPDTLSFNTPHQMAMALAEAGIDGCDFASNHTMDRGLSGLATTEQVMRQAGMGFAGPTADESRSGQAEIYEVPTESGIARVGHLAYTYTYPNSGGPTTHIPGEAPWLVDASWPSIGSAGILDQARQARDEGADFVIVSMHWGGEYQAHPLDEQSQLARELLESDEVDLILGTHVHVIQPCEMINDKHVLYGLGNFLSNQSPVTNFSLAPATQEGMVALVTLRRDEQGRTTTDFAYQPTRVEIAAADPPGPHIVRLVSPLTYPETWERTVGTVDLLGGCEATVLQP